MKTKRNRRWRLLADLQLQSQMLLRIAVYWIACQTIMTITIVGFYFLQEGGNASASVSIGSLLIPSLTVSVLFLPLVLFDFLAFSNRFAGPLFNFRQKFKQLAETGQVSELFFRKGDYLLDLQENFNLLRKQLRIDNQETGNEDNEPKCCATSHRASVELPH